MDRAPSARRVLLAIGVLLLASWTLFATVVLPGGYRAGAGTFGVGLALTAFVLGMRHAFDADHIAAIDNTSRKLLADGHDPSSVGLWFALGHSTVVLVAVGTVTAGVGALASQIGTAGSPLLVFAGVWGPTISSLFLLAVAAVNLMMLIRVIRRRNRAGSEEERSGAGGVVSLAIARTSAALDAPWKMVVVGLLFGLGFDTASTITLLLITGGLGVAMPWYAAMTLPLLFTAGMVMCDGINSIVTTRIYHWSAERTGTRRRYNIALVTVSIAVAFVVGAVGLCGVLVDSAGVRWTPVEAIASTDLGSFGLVIVATILLTWFVSWMLVRTRTSATT